MEKKIDKKKVERMKRRREYDEIKEERKETRKQGRK